MAFIRVSSPHAQSGARTAKVMQQVLLATLPGIIVMTLYFGAGTLANIALAGSCALLFEAAILAVRKRPIGFYLKDCSALVTALLLALAIPPASPWWVVVTGVFFAIVVAKHLYGGLGFNPFNPAMVAYVVLLISFPVEMTRWVAPAGIDGGQGLLGPVTALSHIWMGAGLDGYTGATPLDIVKQNGALTLDAVYQSEPILAMGRFAGGGWEWVNLAFLGGGLWLLYKKVFTWHAPVAMLTTLAFMAVMFYDSGSSASGGAPVFHLLSGGTMLGAFFIVTDPVTSSVSNRGRLIYGALIGLLVYVIRVWGNYPDAVAFAVLLLNFAAPFIDYYTLPRTYGHRKAQRATVKK